MPSLEIDRVYAARDNYHRILKLGEQGVRASSELDGLHKVQHDMESGIAARLRNGYCIKRPVKFLGKSFPAVVVDYCFYNLHKRGEGYDSPSAFANLDSASSFMNTVGRFEDKLVLLTTSESESKGGRYDVAEAIVGIVKGKPLMKIGEKEDHPRESRDVLLTFTFKTNFNTLRGWKSPILPLQDLYIEPGFLRPGTVRSKPDKDDLSFEFEREGLGNRRFKRLELYFGDNLVRHTLHMTGFFARTTPPKV